MYDTISQTFYTNQGTGTFLKGEDVDKTFYGGYVDLISGELVEEYHGFIADGENIKANIGYRSTSTNTAGGGFVYIENKDYPSLPDGKNTNNIYCDKLISKNVGSQKNCLYHASNGQLYFIAYVLDINEDNITTKTEAKDKTNEWLKSNPLQIVYELKTPITHQLTSTQLKSFVGQNNFWSNADYVEIEYDLIETEDIQKCRKKIILNQPHIESATGDVVNFTTNMKAPLKECKVYFSPIQEGSGDPSPDNVRNIVGWDGVNVGLPDEYQEVEWIGNNGTQYIKTNYFPSTDNVDITCSYMFTQRQFGDGMICGIQGSSSAQTLQVEFYNHSAWYVGVGRSNFRNVLNNVGATLNTKYELHANNTALTIDGQSVGVNTIRNNSWFPRPLSIFAWATGYNEAALINKGCNIYQLTIKENNNVVADFIPCYRKSDGEIGMYDTISKTFYTNSGTGTFLKGDDVNTIIGNVSWTDEVGTVYGGYVDLAKGEVVAEYNTVDLGTLTCAVEYDEAKTYSLILPSATTYQEKDEPSNLYCSSLTPLETVKTIGLIRSMGFNNIAKRAQDTSRLYVRSELDTADAVKASLAGYIVAYKLAEPIHYSFTPQQLLTFKGENNIWSDTNGQTEVKFWTH